MRPRRLRQVCVAAGLERDKFDNKTVSFEEHFKLEHNIWNYLYFIVLLREKNKTDYTGPESYVALMIKVRRLEPDERPWGGSHLKLCLCFRTTTWTGSLGCRRCLWW